MTDYLKQANDFLEKTDTKIQISFVGTTINQDWNEKEKRNLYYVILSNPRGEMAFNFWDSIHNTTISQMDLKQYSKKTYQIPYEDLTYGEKVGLEKKLKKAQREAKPTVYDILTCLTKYDPGTFKNFCWDYGYDEDSIRALKIYLAVQEEWGKVSKIFTPKQLEELREIE